MSTEWLGILVETTVACSLAMLLILLARRPMIRWLGTHAAYLAWIMVPLVTLAVLLPARKAEVLLASQATADAAKPLAMSLPAADTNVPVLILVAWMTGVLCMLLVQLARQRRFIGGLGALDLRADGAYASASALGLPALVGLLSPRVVLPVDFDTRFSQQERRLILHHERVHLVRGDLWANAIALIFRCVYWFNPLVHLAARRFRNDQELACDQAVVARFPQQRRIYADAMLKTQLAAGELPLGCHWTARQPLKERILMLKRPVVSRRRWLTGIAMASLLAGGTAIAAWATQPAGPVAAPSAKRYQLSLQVDVDGRTRQAHTSLRAGEILVLEETSPTGIVWHGEFTIEPTQVADQLKLGGKLTASGRLVGEPVLLFQLGHEASIRLSTEDGRSIFGVAVTAIEAAVGAMVVPAPASEVRVRTMSAPGYPATAIKDKIAGRVSLKILVGKDGKTKEVQVEDSMPQGVFDEASVSAAKLWTFEPAMQDGQAVESWIKVPVDFSPTGPVDGAVTPASTGDPGAT